MAKNTEEQLVHLLSPYYQYERVRLRHIKSGGYYRVDNVHLRESDLSVWFSYYSLRNPRLKFSRPISELLDGRWEMGGSWCL